MARWLDLAAVKEACVESDTVLDGLLSSLVAIAAKTGSTHRPSAHQLRPAGRGLAPGAIGCPRQPQAQRVPAVTS